LKNILESGTAKGTGVAASFCARQKTVNGRFTDKSRSKENIHSVKKLRPGYALPLPRGVRGHLPARWNRNEFLKQIAAMAQQTKFSRSYFEQELPKLQQLVDRNGQPPCVILTLDEGHQVELRDFQLTPTRLVFQVSSGYYSVPFHTIRGIQFVPRNRKQLVLSAAKLSRCTEQAEDPEVQ
jgi:hypothetical protein